MKSLQWVDGNQPPPFPSCSLWFVCYLSCLCRKSVLESLLSEEGRVWLPVTIFWEGTVISQLLLKNGSEAAAVRNHFLQVFTSCSFSQESPSGSEKQPQHQPAPCQGKCWVSICPSTGCSRPAMSNGNTRSPILWHTPKFRDTIWGGDLTRADVTQTGQKENYPLAGQCIFLWHPTLHFTQLQHGITCLLTVVV